METTAAVFVDAFATDPTGGLPVAVLPDGADLTDDQLRAAAGEVGTTVAVPDDTFESLRVTGMDGPRHRDTAALVATLARASERDRLDSGARTVTTSAGDRSVTVAADGRVWVDLAGGAGETAPGVTEEPIADALGIDVAALRDVGGDLPPARIEGETPTLAVAVNFLEHLRSVSPDSAALAALAEAADVDAVCAFTFDTLDAETTCHARTFLLDGTRRPRAHGQEVPVTPQIAGSCVAHLAERGAIDDGAPRIEQGHFLDRPARIDVRLSEGTVGGRAVTSFDGTLTLPPSEDDDIIEI